MGSGASAAGPPPSMPLEAPVAMPEQRLDVFDQAGRRAFADAEKSASPFWPRIAVFGGATAITAGAVFEMGRSLALGGLTPLELVVVVLFALNIGWIALTFVTAAAGAVLVARSRPKSATALPVVGRTAVLMPIYNENPARIFAAIEAMASGVRSVAPDSRFDWFVAERHDGSRHCARGRDGVPRLAFTLRGKHPALLSPPPTQPGAKVREHCRLLPSLGRLLRLFHHPRRRQPHGARGYRRDGAPDGCRSRRRADPNCAATGPRPNGVCPPAAIRRPGLRPGSRGGTRLVDRAGGQLLGAQRHSPPPRLCGCRRSAKATRPAALRRRYPEPRFRRGSAHPARRLDRADRRRHRRFI